MDMPSALHGLRVLDLSDEQGQFCARLMADMGADVIKIEPPDGDSVRRLGPFYHDQEVLDKSLAWFLLNTSKLGTWTVCQTAREVMQRLQAAGVPAAMV